MFSISLPDVFHRCFYIDVFATKPAVALNYHMMILNDEEVRTGLEWPTVLAALQEAFAHKSDYTTPERVVIAAPGGGSLLTMPCADAEGWFGVKQVSVLPGNVSRGKPTVQAWYTLFDPEGTPALACSASELTRIRTAGVSALVADYLAPQTAKTLLVVGTGSLAPRMAEAHAQVREYERILVWGRNEQKAERTAAEIRGRVKTSVSVAPSLEDAVAGAEVISVATTARSPIIEGRWLRAGQHLDLVGAFTPEMAEADAEAVKQADVFVDDVEAATTEAGDLIQAQAQGWSLEAVYGEVRELIIEETQRPTPSRVTLFKSVGLAFEDLAVAKLLL